MVDILQQFPVVETARASLLAIVKRLNIRYTYSDLGDELDLAWGSDAASYMRSATFDAISDGSPEHDEDAARALTAEYLKNAVNAADADGWLIDSEDIESDINFQVAVCDFYMAIAGSISQCEDGTNDVL